MGDPIVIKDDPSPALSSNSVIEQVKIKKNSAGEYNTELLGGDALNVQVLFDNNDHIITDKITSPSYSESLATVLNSLANYLNDIAPKYHASTSTEYGAASTTQYGHVKLGYGLKLADDGSTMIDSSIVISPTDSRLTNAREPISHAFDLDDSNYGVGSSSLFGHVKLSDIYNTLDPDRSTSGANAGVAASAYALQQAYNDMTYNLSQYSTTTDLIALMKKEIDDAVDQLLNTPY